MIEDDPLDLETPPTFKKLTVVEKGEKKPDPISEHAPIALSDDHLADAFARRYQDNFRYVHGIYKWKIWRETQWEDDKTHQCMTAARDLCRASMNWAEAASLTHATKAKIDSHGTAGKVLSFATTDPRLATIPEQWDCDNWLLGTPGGVYDLKTGRSRAGKRTDYVSLKTAVAPERGEPVEWLKYLAATHRGNNEVISFLKRFIGYALTGDVTEHALVFAYGTGRNGKGVMMDTVLHILGDYGLAAPISVFSEQKFEKHSTEIAQLRGKRFVTAEEPSSGQKWDESRIKWLTGGGNITARRMRQDDVTFAPTWKLFFAGNHIPALRHVDEAIKARFNIVPFTRTFAPEERDPLLREKLKLEAPRILNWMMEGCVEWRKSGLQVPATCRAATDEYMQSEDVVGEFLEENCNFGEDLYVQAGELYKKFAVWTEEHGETVPTQKNFTAEMSTRTNIKRKRMTMGVRFYGISLK
jgi:putative DNA primase/helicase